MELQARAPRARGRRPAPDRAPPQDAEGIHARFDVRDAARKAERDRCRARDCEVLEVLNARAGKRPDHVHVFDLEGLTLGMLTRKTVNVVVDIIGISNEREPASRGRGGFRELSAGKTANRRRRRAP